MHFQILDLNIRKCKSKFFFRKGLDLSPNIKSTTFPGEYEIRTYERIKLFFLNVTLPSNETTVNYMKTFHGFVMFLEADSIIQDTTSLLMTFIIVGKYDNY